MSTTFLRTLLEIEHLIFSLLPIQFCLLSLFVLAYYIRRRYKLYKEIRRVPQNLLIMESYRNHLKNLKLKCIINNFIVVILVLEFSVSFGEVIHYLPCWFQVFDKEYKSIFLKNVKSYTYLLIIPLRYSNVPTLCLVMNFLWLAYRKYEYKYTIIRWTWYILVRTAVILLVICVYSHKLLSDDYSAELYTLSNQLLGYLQIIDFVQYVYYTRKFYFHLKSREEEIRLFYFDKKAYLDSRYLRIHFKIASILVATAIFFFSFSGFIVVLWPLSKYSKCLPIPLRQSHLISLEIMFFLECLVEPLLMFYKMLITFNYLYIFIVVVYKSYRDRQKLANINDYIRPIVKQYHDNYYNRYTNYA